MRNVSRTLGLNATSESSLVQAIELSKKALTLQLEYLKDYMHPGMIGNNCLFEDIIFIILVLLKKDH